MAIATYLRNGFKSTEFEILVAPFALFAAALQLDFAQGQRPDSRLLLSLFGRRGGERIKHHNE